MNHRLPVLALLLSTCWVSACWVGPAEVQDKIDYVGVDPSEVPQRITITAVDPPWGTSAGGSEVVVELDGDVGDGVQVFFGAAEATVTAIGDGEITVETPPGSEVVDVHLEWGAKAGRLDDAFTYYPDATNKYGLVGSLSWYDVVGPLASVVDDEGFAWMNFIEPGQHGYGDLYGPGLDACESSWSFPGDLTETGDAARLDLASIDGDPLGMPWDARADAYIQDLTLGGGTNSFRIGTTYDLQTVDAPNLPPIFVKGLVHTTSPFRVYTHCSLGFCTPHAPLDGDDVAIVLQNDLILEWDEADTPGDYMVVRLQRWEETSTDVWEMVEEVRCRLRDDGEFEVPSTVWKVANDLGNLDIYMGRVRESTAVLPHNNAATGVAGIYWVVGTTAFVPL